MPYKTPFGNHYHMQLGCCGAFIPCKAGELVPCSICCADRIQEIMAGELKLPRSMTKQTAGAPSRARARTSSHGSSQGASSHQGSSASMMPASDATGTGTTDNGTGSTQIQLRENSSEVQAFLRTLDRSVTASDLSSDASGDKRFAIVQQIDRHIDSIPDADEGERLRRQIQEAWNEEHPDAPIMVWGKDEGYDDGYQYFEDMERSVTLLVEPDSIFGDLKTSIWDKATGEEMTAIIHHEDYMLRKVKKRIDTLEREIRVRDSTQQMLRPENRVAYDRWLAQKRQHSKDPRYHNTRPSFDEALQLRIQFDKETNNAYRPVTGRLLPTDEEQEILDRMYAERDETQGRLDALLTRYGFDEVILSTLQFQYLEVDRFGVPGDELDPLADDNETE